MNNNKSLEHSLSEIERKNIQNVGTNKKLRIIPKKYRFFGAALNLASYVSMKFSSNMLTRLWFMPLLRPTANKKVLNFWASADAVVAKDGIKFYTWGKNGPLIFCVHGWSGNGRQFRNFIDPLVAQNFRVVLFDAPGHGMNLRRPTHLKEMSDSLVKCQEVFGPPASIISHSIGCQVAVQAIRDGLRTNSLVCCSPGVNLENMFLNYCLLLGLRTKLIEKYRDAIESKAKQYKVIAENESLWKKFSVEECANSLDVPGIVFFDRNDEELLRSDVDHFVSSWGKAVLKLTVGNGHYRILGDLNVVGEVIDYLIDLNIKKELFDD